MKTRITTTENELPNPATLSWKCSRFCRTNLSPGVVTPVQFSGLPVETGDNFSTIVERHKARYFRAFGYSRRLDVTGGKLEKSRWSVLEIRCSIQLSYRRIKFFCPR